jgi:hypothetical protein
LRLQSIALLIPFVAILTCCQNKKVVDKTVTKDTVANNIIPKMLWDSTNTLEKKIQILRLNFYAMGCACPEWLPWKYRNKEDYYNYCIYIEPADSSIWNPEDDSLAWETGIIATGQFYVKEGYPKGAYEGMEDLPPPGKIFRYTKARRVTK